MTKENRRRSLLTGFTLIELMIALGIAALIAILGLPSFNSYIQKVRRADAQTTLLELAHLMERNYAVNGSYLINNAAPTLPITKAPRESSNPSYNIHFSIITAQNYTLQATPTENSGQINDSCGTLSLRNDGTTLPTTEKCWVQ